VVIPEGKIPGDPLAFAKAGLEIIDPDSISLSISPSHLDLILLP
jgi:hypothetical protein